MQHCLNCRAGELEIIAATLESVPIRIGFTSVPGYPAWPWCQEQRARHAGLRV